MKHREYLHFPAMFQWSSCTLLHGMGTVCEAASCWRPSDACKILFGIELQSNLPSLMGGKDESKILES